MAPSISYDSKISSPGENDCIGRWTVWCYMLLKTLSSSGSTQSLEVFLNTELSRPWITTLCYSCNGISYQGLHIHCIFIRVLEVMQSTPVLPGIWKLNFYITDSVLISPIMVHYELVLDFITTFTLCIFC